MKKDPSKKNQLAHSVAIIIPMYNEEVGAERCINQVIPEVQKLRLNAALLVVNDGSKDRTPKILDQLAKKYHKDLIVVHHPKNQGYGAALQTGMREAYQNGFEFGLFMDSDLTNSPKDIPRFVEQIGESYDCIKATRYSKGGKMEGVPAHRQFISWLGNQVASRLFRVGLHDCTNGFRMVRLSLVQDLELKERGFASIVEELYFLKKKKARFMEVPVTLTSRIDTESSFRYNAQTFWNYLKYALKAALC